MAVMKSIHFIKNILRKFGLNEAIFYFLSSKFFSFIATPVTLYLITTHFTASVQGYYYTFYSLLGISIFFELGLGVVITQFASHEFAHVSWTHEGNLRGDPVALDRIISLLRKSLKWYGIISILCVIFIIPIGLCLFASNIKNGVNVNYALPWILLTLFFGIGTFFVPLYAFLEGCGRVAQVQKLRLVQNVVSIVIFCSVVLLKGDLMAVSLQFMASVLVAAIWFIYKYKGLFKQISQFNLSSKIQISWRNEIFPMQWRIAVSWMAAYFSGFLFVPLIFKYRGAVEAGQLGMSLKLSETVYLISMAWISTRTPLFGSLIQQKKHEELRLLAKRSTFQAVFVGLMLSVAIVTGLLVLYRYFPSYNQRTLPVYAVGILCLSTSLGMIAGGIAGYLRAHRQEPLMFPSIIIAVVTSIFAYISAKYFNANIMAIMSACVSIFIAIPSYYYVLRKKRKEWYDLKGDIIL
jgi:hypothetical protein